MLLAFVGGAYKFIYNHIAHMQAQMTRNVDAARLQIEGLAADLRSHMVEEKDYFNRQFDSLQKDIRELRDWTIVMRGKRTK